MLDKGIKDSVRKKMLRKRDSIPPEIRRAKNSLIQERLSDLNEFKNAQVKFIFASFRNEVETIDMIKKTFLDGRQIVLPKVDRKRHMLLLFRVKSLDELSPGCMGISEPAVNTEERQVEINDVDVVIIPGLAFDISGNRIGYGAGYYDILLAGLKKDIPIIAPAFEEQVEDSLPSEAHDVKVHIVVTDRRVIRCR
jgi:5-formyltetrahydrofolate cyclo-ligase